jgi:hypothetical protein
MMRSLTGALFLGRPRIGIYLSSQRLQVADKWMADLQGIGFLRGVDCRQWFRA